MFRYVSQLVKQQFCTLCLYSDALLRRSPLATKGFNLCLLRSYNHGINIHLDENGGNINSKGTDHEHNSSSCKYLIVVSSSVGYLKCVHFYNCFRLH